jgi:hypothetical protein
MSVVIFDYSRFVAAYPAFNAVSSAALQQCFNLACILLNNTENSLVTDLTTRESLLWMLVAHIATLSGQTNANVASGTAGASSGVGRTASATEGSVSISLDYPMTNPNAAYYNQTQYGAMYWQMILPFRSFRYRGRNVTII